MPLPNLIDIIEFGSAGARRIYQPLAICMSQYKFLMKEFLIKKYICSKIHMSSKGFSGLTAATL